MRITMQLSPRRKRALTTSLAGLIVGGVLIAIEVRQGAEPGKAIVGLGFLVAFMAVLLIFQTRSETMSTLAGDPVDERWRLIHERALVGAANVSTMFALAAYGIAELAGIENWQFALMIIVLSLTYLAGVVWYRRRL
jgi:hypothetical protein